jgi:regulator of sirC expression with transglutaminase-like and TPR domain
MYREKSRPVSRARKGPLAETSFQEQIKRSPIDVLHAALCCAREVAYPELDIEHYRSRIDQLALAARGQLSGFMPMSEQAAALSNFLFSQQGFQGNRAEYLDPRNSYLNEVIERKLGIPISLSVIYIAIAQELGIPAQGVGLPGHFIVGIHESGEEIYLDPFHGGVRLSQTDCAQLVRESTGFSGAFEAEWLKPISATALLTRMLNNLRNIYFRQEDWSHAQAVLEHLRMLQPNLADLLRDLGMVNERKGALRLAIHYYEQYLRQSPQAADAENVLSRLRGATQQLSQLN